MPNYMLILHESTTGFADYSLEDIQKIIADYVAWSDKLGADGKLVGGNKLRDDSAKMLFRDESGLRVTDGPFTESKEVIGGYFEIVAADYDEAVMISSTCPHLTYGGRIELREIEPTND